VSHSALLLALVLASSPPPADATKSPKGKPAELFQQTKVWKIHATIAAKDWTEMQPKRGGFGFGGFGGFGGPGQPDTSDRPSRGMFGYDFVYVKCALEIDGIKMKDVGIRFKGNAGYMMSARGLKRPFRLDFAKFVKGQSFKGVKKVSLNNNVVDTTCAREAISYAVYRAAGVAAPRTSMAELYLTVPGKYDKELLGTYTIVEAVDRVFLKNHFGSAAGLLLKPEKIRSLDYLGTKWSPYEEKYRPKTKSSGKSRKRLIEFTRLVNKGSDEQFKKEIASYLDVDRFLRFMAASVALSTMDSFIGLGHNYYLYLNPKTNKWVFMPWDLDHSLGAFPMMGTPDNLADLSIRQPYSGSNKLIERLLKDEKNWKTYQEHLKGLLAKGFKADEIKKDYASIVKAVKDIRTREQKAAKDRKETGGWGWGGAAMWGMPLEPDAFVAKRVVSLKKQLDGKSKGFVPRGWGFGGPGGRPGAGRPGGPGGVRPGGPPATKPEERKDKPAEKKKDKSGETKEKP